MWLKIWSHQSGAEIEKLEKLSASSFLDRTWKEIESVEQSRHTVSGQTDFPANKLNESGALTYRLNRELKYLSFILPHCEIAHPPAIHLFSMVECSAMHWSCGEYFSGSQISIRITTGESWFTCRGWILFAIVRLRLLQYSVYCQHVATGSDQSSVCRKKSSLSLPAESERHLLLLLAAAARELIIA